MTTVDIAEMPVSEKLKLMEALWDSLSTGTGKNFESPAWHEQALKQAEHDHAAGTAHFVDWPEAKELLRKRGQS